MWRALKILVVFCAILFAMALASRLQYMTPDYMAFALCVLAIGVVVGIILFRKSR